MTLTEIALIPGPLGGAIVSRSSWKIRNLLPGQEVFNNTKC